MVRVLAVVGLPIAVAAGLLAGGILGGPAESEAGPLAYFAGGGSAVSRAVRWFRVLGGLATYFGIATLALFVEAL